MITLEQIFDKSYDNDNKICTRKSLFEQFKEINREWLQPKPEGHIKDCVCYICQFVKGLLEELNEEKQKEKQK